MEAILLGRGMKAILLPSCSLVYIAAFWQIGSVNGVNLEFEDICVFFGFCFLPLLSMLHIGNVFLLVVVVWFIY